MSKQKSGVSRPRFFMGKEFYFLILANTGAER